MPLNLEELSFQVNTEKLKDAITELGNLKTAVSNLNSTSSQAATEQSKLVKSTEKLTDSTEGSTGKLSAVEKMLDKTATKMKVLRGQTIELADGVENLGKGFTSSQASQVATVRLLGATTDQIKMLTQSFKEYNDMTGVNTFDASGNGLSRLNKEIKELTSVSQLAAKGYGLTRDELKLLTRDSNALTQAFNQEGRSIEELTTGLNRLEQEFVSASKQRNALIAQSKQVELQVKSEADAIAAAARAQEDSSQSMFRNHQLRLKQEEQTHKAIMSDMAAFYKEQEKLNNVPTPSQQPMDSAVAQYYKQQSVAANESAKAMAYVEREMLRIDNVLEGFNTNLAISSSNRLLKFREQLALTGVDATTAALKYEDYAERVRKADEYKAKRQKSAREDELKYLARATSVQLGDIGVSLAGGQNPFIVLIQQGDQLRGVLNQVGGDAKEMQQAMSLAFKQIVVGFVDVAKALGSFVAGALLDTSKALINSMNEVLFLNKIFEAGVSKLDSMGFTKTAEFLRGFSALASGVVAAAMAGAIVYLGALAVALKEVIKQESELSKAVNLTGGAIALNTQEAVNLASAYAGTKGNIGAYTEAITEAAKAGNIGSDSLQAITTSAIELEKVAGVAVKDTIKQFSELAKSPTEAAIKLAESTGLIKPEVIAVVAELERQGDKANAAAIATRAYADSLLDATKVIKSDMSTWEIIFGSIGSSASSMWDKILNVGRKGDLNKQLEAATSDLEARTREGKRWYQHESVYQTELAQLKEIKESLENHVQVQQDQIKLKEQQRRATQAQVQVEQFLNQQKEEQEKLSTKQATRQEAVAKAEEKLLKLRREGAIITDQAIEQAKKLEGIRWDASQKKTGKSDAQRELERIEKETASVVKSFDAMRAKSTGYVEDLSQAAIKLREIQQGESWGKMSDAQKQRILNAMKVAEIEEHIADMVKDQLKDQLALQKVWDEAIKKQAQIDQANFDALHAIDAKYATQVDAYDLLVLEASLIGKTAEEQKKVLGLKKIELEYEKEIQAIENKKGINDSTRKALLDKQLQIRKQAELNLNTEIANDAARKLLEEYNRIRDGISDAIVTALFEGGKAGSKKLRDFLVAELKRPITLYVQAVVSDLMGVAGIGSGSSSGLVGTIGSSISSMGSSFLGTGGIGAATSAFTTGASAALGGADLTAAIAAYTEAGMSGVAAGLSAGGSVGSALAAIPGWGWALAGAALLAGSMDDSGTSHMGGLASYSKASGATTSKINRGNDTYYVGGSSSAAGFSADYSQSTTDIVSAMAKGVTQLLDSTAETFGKTAGYAVSTAFADDTSDDGAWGSLVVRLGDSLVSSWEDSRVSKWAPKVFADGEAGAKEYSLAVAKTVRDLLIEQTPDWADTMLNALGNAPSIESLTNVVTQINSTQLALQGMGEASAAFAAMGADASNALITAMGGAQQAIAGLQGYYANFYSETERQTIARTRLTERLGEKGEALPQSRLAFRDRVDAAITSGDTDLAAFLIEQSAAYAEVTPEIQQYTEAVQSSTPVIDEAAKAMERLTEKFANARDSLIETSKSLGIDLLRAQGNEQAALDAERANYLAGFADLGQAEIDRLASLYDQNQAIRDQIKAIEKSKAMAEERKSLEQQLLEATGNTLEIRKRELAALDESNRPLKQRLFDLEDEAKRLALTAETAEKAKAELDAMNAAIASLWSAADAAADKFLTGDKLKLFKLDRLAMQINEAIGSSLSGLQLDSSSVDQIKEAVMGFVSSNAAPEAKTAILQLGSSLIDLKQAAIDAAKASVDALWAAADSAADKFFTGDKLITFRFDRLAVQVNDAIGSSLSGLQLQSSSIGEVQAAVLDFVSSNATPEAKAAIMQLGASLVDMKQSALDAAAAAAKATAEQRSGLERQLLELQGDTAAIRAVELAAIEPSNKALQQHIWALQDLKTASDAAAEAARTVADAERARADQQLGLQLKIANLTGSNEALRAHELSLLSGDLNKALQQHIWTLEDQKTANDAAAEAAKSATDALSKSLDDAYSALERSVEAEKALLQESISTKEEVINNLKSVFDLLSSEARKLYQEVDSTGTMLSADARKYIQSVAYGNEGFDSDKLQEAVSSSMSGIDKTLYKTKADADKDRLLLANDLATAAKRAGVQLTTEEESLGVLRGQYDALENVLEVAKNQINELRNIDTSVKDLLTAQQEFTQALTASKQKTDTESTAGIANNATATDSVLTASQMFGGFESLEDLVVHSEVLDAETERLNEITRQANAAFAAILAGGAFDYVKGIDPVAQNVITVATQATSASDLPSFATGGFHSGGLRLVGEEGPELEVTGPAKYYSANQTSSMLSGANNDRLADQLEMMRHEIRANVQYTSKLAKQLERLTVPTDDGEALQVKSVV